MFLENKNVLVTGGAGFIGSNLVKRIISFQPRKIYILDNFVAGKLSNLEEVRNLKNIEIVKGDVRNFPLVNSLVAKMDYVYHLAASKLVVSLLNPRIDLETNIIGTFNILEAARRNKKARIVHASTGSTLGSSEKPMKEGQHPRPTTLYGISKLSAEHYCLFYTREFGVKVSVIRYFHVYGPHQDYSGKAGVVNIFLSRVLRGKPPVVCGSGEQIRCLTFVQDDIEATLFIAKRADTIGQIYNIASPERIRVKDLAKMIIDRYASKKLKIIYGPPRQGENLRPIPDTGKIEALGFKAKYPFEKGLEETKLWIEKDLNQNRIS